MAQAPIIIDEPLFTPLEVATNLRVDVSTVHRWIKKGKLAAIQLPGHGVRIPQRELARIRAGATNGAD